ncbi:CapA family protein [Phototrophicus methaneseepsis]|uniref:CapA family protein n=1 Tax=Phototrophicus methaneseepsis TaxID=2710758 RepID=A0A7S8E753_9CHLR|nr:CapA family protein [Phototrophicus methaneseepsis]QPC81618.1 CapA family protein [Phototrophicus methaneseepsis]
MGPFLIGMVRVTVQLMIKRRIFICLLLFAGMVASAPVFLPVSAQDICPEKAGTTTRETYPSGLLGQTMYYTVYTPPCYEQSEAAYPVLYLMHGSNEDDGHWIRLGIEDVLNAGIADGTLPPMVVVLPFGNLIANRNWFDALSWGNIFMTELLPQVEATYRLDGRRAIGGISRGGFWAYNIGLKHPDMFPVIGGHSAYFDPGHAPETDNPLDLITTVDLTGMRFWIDRGKDDFAYPGLDLMAERMAEAGADYQYIVQPEGQHYNTYWSLYVADYLAFYAADWLEPSTPPQPTATPPGIGAFATNTPIAPMQITAQATVPQPTASQPVPMPTATLESTQVTSQAATSGTWQVYFPVVAFPSLMTSLSMETAGRVAQGEALPALILDTETAAAMQAAGFNLSPEVRLVEPSDLRNALWRDYNAFTLLPMDRIAMDMRLLWVDDVPVVDMLEQYPLAKQAANGNYDPALLQRVTLSGVTALTRYTTTMLDQNGVEWAASGIEDYVKRSDFFHTSNEVSMYPTCPQTNEPVLGGPTSFCSKPSHFDLLPLLDVDVVELTGNHNNDYGYNAYAETYDYYVSQGMATIGGGLTVAQAQAPLILPGENVAMLACNFPGPYYALVNEDPSMLGGLRPGAALCDWHWLEEALPALAEEVETVIVSVQYQEVEDYLPLDQQYLDFRKLADLGADVVIGTAAHKPQTFEFYQTQRGDRSLIHYGLGNLFFDQPFWGNSRFFMDTIYVYGGRLQAVELFPGLIEEQARPRLMTPDEREAFLYFMFRQQNGF